jgi:hypothetical protein
MKMDCRVSDWIFKGTWNLCNSLARRTKRVYFSLLPQDTLILFNYWTHLIMLRYNRAGDWAKPSCLAPLASCNVVMVGASPVVTFTPSNSLLNDLCLSFALL